MRFAQAMPAALQDGCARTCLAAAIMVKRAAATSIGLCGMGSWGQAAAAVWAVVAGHCCSLEPLLQLGCCCCMIVESGCNPVSSMLLWVDGAVPDEGANHIRGRQQSKEDRPLLLSANNMACNGRWLIWHTPVAMVAMLSSRH